MFSRLVHVHTTLRPGGGPPGYLFNLNKVCQEKNSSTVVVKAVNVEESRNSGGARFSNLPKWLHRNIRPAKQIVNMLGLIPCGLETFLGDRQEALCVHLAPYAARLLRKRSAGQAIFFMPHGPLTYSDELMNEMDLRYGKGFLSDWYRKILNSIERRLFERVNGVVVACKEGLNSYFGGVVPSCKLYEVLSGVPVFSEVVDRSVARQKLKLPHYVKIIGFFGRFNEDKGFDFFLNTIRHMGERKDVLFISAGAGSIEPISSPAYINFGWRSDIHILMSACDAIVLPNRATYFDLLPLEIMSIGRAIFASRVGGNVRLAKLANVVQLFDLETKYLVELIEKFLTLSEEQCNLLETESRNLYKQKFSMDVFYANHLTLFKSISQGSPC